MNALRFVLIFATLTGYAMAADNEKPSEPPKFSNPLEKLPKHIVAKKGELTLFADYDNAVEGRVPLYIVNRTGKAIKFNAQDGSIYQLLEYEAKPGKWVRAEPHAFSWCGNSYIEKKLDSDCYAEVRGNLFVKGDDVKVRYSLYLQEFKLSSNVTSGRIYPKEVEKAANDDMAVRSGDFEFVSKVATGVLKLKNEVDHIDDLRRSAIGELSDKRFDRAEAEKVLRSIAEGKDKPYAEQAGGVLRSLKKQEK